MQNMEYIVETEKPFEQAAADLAAAVSRNQFGVLHVHDLQATLKSKGFDFPNACRIFEVCNPKQAQAVLSRDMSLNMALPCRISVYEDNGTTRIGMISPKAMLSTLSGSAELAQIAEEVETVTRRIIDEAR